MRNLNQASADIHSIGSTYETWMEFNENDAASNVDAEYSNEQVREIRFALGQIFRLYDAAFYAREYSMIGEVEWSRMERNICRLAARIGQFWDDYVRRGLSEVFTNFVDNECVEADGE